MDAQPTSFSSLFCRGHGEHFRHEHGYSFFDFVHPTFPQPNMVLPTIQSALKDDFGEAVVACDMPKPCKFPSLDSCQRRFLWTHKRADLALHPVVGLLLQVGDTEKFPLALSFESSSTSEILHNSIMPSRRNRVADRTRGIV